MFFVHGTVTHSGCQILTHVSLPVIRFAEMIGTQLPSLRRQLADAQREALKEEEEEAAKTKIRNDQEKERLSIISQHCQTKN